MPQRPKQHQLEDYSTNKFKQLIPASWIVGKKEKDYGIDLEIEIVDSNNKVTGEIFLVQLKATDSSKSSVIQSVSMKIETLNYYKSLQLLVMLVRYSKKMDQFFFKWVKIILIYIMQKGTKTVKISFENKNLWIDTTVDKNQNSFKKITAFKTGFIQLPVSLSLNILERLIKSENPVVTESRLVSQLSQYNQLVKIEDDFTDPLFSAIIQKSEIKINASEVTFCVFHNPSLNVDQILPKLVTTQIFIGIAMILCRIGKFELATKIIIESDLLPTVVKMGTQFELLLLAVLKSPYMEEAITVIENIAQDEGKLNVSILSHLALLSLQRDESIRLIGIAENILNKRLENALKKGIKQNIAIAYYNLGTH